MLQRTRRFKDNQEITSIFDIHLIGTSNGDVGTSSNDVGESHQMPTELYPVLTIPTNSTFSSSEEKDILSE